VRAGIEQRDEAGGIGELAPVVQRFTPPARVGIVRIGRAEAFVRVRPRRDQCSRDLEVVVDADGAVDGSQAVPDIATARTVRDLDDRRRVGPAFEERRNARPNPGRVAR
jgi:hypothetical protein